MVQSFFDDLGDDFIDPDAKREIIRNYLPGLIDEGFSANASLSLFQDVGLGIGRSDFLGIYREVLGLEDQQNRVRYVRGDSVPSEGILGVYESPIDTEYRFIYKYSFTDPKTGDTVESYIGVNRNTLDTLENMEADAAEEIRERYADGIGDLQSIQTWKGFKAK